MITECPREQDVLDAIDARRWPDRCDEALRRHVAGCAVCGDLARVAGALGEDYERLWRQASVPPASLVWWRAELRARAEAERAVARPLLAAQVTLAMVVAGLAAAWLVAGPAPATAGWDLAIASGAVALVDAVAAAPAAIGAIPPALVPAIWFAAAAWALAIPAAIYVAFRG